MSDVAALQRLNALAPDGAEALLLTCCGSNDWAHGMTEARPFHSLEQLFATADQVWWSLGRLDWLEAFAAHPKIGDAEGSSWSKAEQAGASAAAPETQAELARLNEEYASRFGHIFIINATGKSAAEIVAALEKRLRNDPGEELHIAAEQQRQITRLRLMKLVRTL